MNRLNIAFVMAIGLAAPAAAQFPGASVPSQGPLGAAKDLYASARYDEALSVLNGLRIGESADRASVEQYRSLCLLALGRSSEAESAIAAVVNAEPTYRPGDAESPRVRATFTEVRKRVLPEITTARYQAAKAAFDRKEWAAAEDQFKLVLSLLDDPDTGGRLSDLRVLTVGFLELSARAAAPPPAPVVEPKPTPAVAAGAPPPAAPAIPTPIPGKIYSADDAMVTPPIVVKQNIPGVPQAMIAMARSRGLLDIVIDEQGRVVSMMMRNSIHPTYDTTVVAAARDWKYKPAKFNGVPVRFRRLIQISVNK